MFKELSANMTKEMDVCWYFMQRRAPEMGKFLLLDIPDMGGMITRFRYLVIEVPGNLI